MHIVVNYDIIKKINTFFLSITLFIVLTAKNSKQARSIVLDEFQNTEKEQKIINKNKNMKWNLKELDLVEKLYTLSKQTQSRKQYGEAGNLWVHIYYNHKLTISKTGKVRASWYE